MTSGDTITTTTEQTVLSPTTADPDLDGEHERMSHIVLEGFRPGGVGGDGAAAGDGGSTFVPAGPTVVESMVNGTAVRALCGKVWVPGRDPRRFPLCPTCREIAEARGWRIPAS